MSNSLCNYVAIRETAILDRNISIYAKGLYTYLVVKAVPTRSVQVSKSDISRNLNVSAHTVIKYMAELEEHGYIRIEKYKSHETNTFQPNIYHILK